MEARDYGYKAFNNGLDCIPMYDTDFVSSCIRGDKFGRVVVVKMREWIKGWTKANLDKIFYTE